MARKRRGRGNERNLNHLSLREKIERIKMFWKIVDSKRMPCQRRKEETYYCDDGSNGKCCIVCEELVLCFIAWREERYRVCYVEGKQLKCSSVQRYLERALGAWEKDDF